MENSNGIFTGYLKNSKVFRNVSDDCQIFKTQIFQSI